MDVPASHLIKAGPKQATPKVYFVQIPFASGNNLLGRKFLQLTWPAVLRNQLWHTSLDQGLPEELFCHHTSCHLPHTSGHILLINQNPSLCSQAWWGPDVPESPWTSAPQAQLALFYFRHDQVSSSLQQPFSFWPTGTLRHLKTSSWLLYLLWSRKEGGAHVMLSLLKLSDL